MASQYYAITGVQYYTSVVTSVYLRNGESGRGSWQTTLQGTAEKSGDTQNCRAYALISLPSDASLRLHKKFGFTDVRILDEAEEKV